MDTPSGESIDADTKQHMPDVPGAIEVIIYIYRLTGLGHKRQNCFEGYIFDATAGMKTGTA